MVSHLVQSWLLDMRRLFLGHAIQYTFDIYSIIAVSLFASNIVCIQKNFTYETYIFEWIEDYWGNTKSSTNFLFRQHRTAKLNMSLMTVFAFAQNAREWHARRYPAEIKLNVVNVVGIFCRYCRFGVILSSAKSKREMRTRTTVRLSRSDAIRNNGLLVRKDKVEWRSVKKMRKSDKHGGRNWGYSREGRALFFRQPIYFFFLPVINVVGRSSFLFREQIAVGGE